MITFRMKKMQKISQFLVQEDVGNIRNATAKEELVICIKDLNILMEMEYLDSIDTHTNTLVMWWM